MYQAKTAQTPPPELAAAIAKFETAQLEQLAKGVAAYGLMPRALNSQQRKAVLILASRVQPSL